MAQGKRGLVESVWSALKSAGSTWQPSAVRSRGLGKEMWRIKLYCRVWCHGKVIPERAIVSLLLQRLFCGRIPLFSKLQSLQGESWTRIQRKPWVQAQGDAGREKSVPVGGGNIVGSLLGGLHFKWISDLKTWHCAAVAYQMPKFISVWIRFFHHQNMLTCIYRCSSEITCSLQYLCILKKKYISEHIHSVSGNILPSGPGKFFYN